MTPTATLLHTKGPPESPWEVEKVTGCE